MRLAGALLQASHPVPGAGVTVIAILLGVAVGLEPWRVAVLGLAIGLGQLSVGWSNDWIDAGRDRASGRTDKPVAVGRIGVAPVRVAAIASAVLALAATVPLGPAALAAHAIALGAAWAYNAGLKATPASALPYLVAFGLLPGIAALARPEPALPTWWAVTAGACLGLAAHLVNVVPDLEDDRRTGVHGMGHRLGARGSTVLAGAALVGAAAAIAIGVLPEPGPAAAAGPPVVAALAAAVAISAVAVGLALARPASRWPFRLVILAALVDVALLVLAGGRLAA